MSVVKVGVARAASDDHDAPFFHVPDGAQPDIGFGHLIHGDGRLDARRNADTLQRILQRQPVHHGGDHAHMIGGRLRHAVLHAAAAAPEIARADHQPYLDTEIVNRS